VTLKIKGRRRQGVAHQGHQHPRRDQVQEGRLLAEFKLERTNWMPFQKSDRYSKQTLVGDSSR